MELNNKKFSNIDRKRIFNTGKLPGFADGSATDLKLQKPTINPTLVSQSSGPNLNQNALDFFGSEGLTKPNTKPIEGQGWSYHSSIMANTNNGQLTNPMGRGESKNIGSPAAGSAAAIHPGFAIGSWLGGGVLEGINAFRKSSDEYLAEAGTSQANINGIAYTKQNDVNTDQIMSNYDNEAGSAWLTNPGKAITMLFGRSKARRAANAAANYAYQMQLGARDEAYTKFLRLDAAKKYGNTEEQTLAGAVNGKLPGFSLGIPAGDKPTYSVAGATNRNPNARLSGHEIVYNKAEGIASEVGGPANNKDQEYGFLRASDGVLSNKPGIFGYSPADMFRATGDIQGAEDYMIASNMAKGKMMFKGGKLPKHADGDTPVYSSQEGWWGNFIPSAIGSLMSLSQILQASRNRPYRPNTYVENPYELEGLSTLAGLRINPYPINRQLREAEARTNRTIDMAGGLSGAQRSSARLSSLYGTQRNIADSLFAVQNQNNQYRAGYAQAAINAGQAARQARMQANQWDLDMYSKAHAARNKGIQTGIANMFSQIQQYQANEFKRRQFNDTMQLYRDDMKQRQENMNWYRNNQPVYTNQAVKGIAADPIRSDITKNYWQLPSDLQRVLEMQRKLGIIS